MVFCIGKLIKQCLKRSTDIGCRYGGEEFCLILPDTDPQGALAFSENLRKLISSQTCAFHDIEINLTISCGVSTYQQQNNIQPEQLFSAADKALYRAKDLGRNQTQQNSFNDANQKGNIS